MFGFEKLVVWQKSRAFANAIYDVVDAFPKSEQFALCQQLRRAAVSVVANIAEGSAKSSNKEFSRYIEMAFGSLCEVIAELYVALDRHYIKGSAFKQPYGKAESLGMMLSKFRGSLEKTWVKSSLTASPLSGEERRPNHQRSNDPRSNKAMEEVQCQKQSY